MQANIFCFYGCLFQDICAEKLSCQKNMRLHAAVKAFRAGFKGSLMFRFASRAFLDIASCKSAAGQTRELREDRTTALSQ
jgi:hypothetical protein